jgi:hypothetical protein
MHLDIYVLLILNYNNSEWNSWTSSWNANLKKHVNRPLCR